MQQLSPDQLELVSSLSKQLGAIRGVRAVVLGGSYARGRAQPGSDIDLGLFYSEADPFSIQSIRELAEAVNDTAGPVVRDFLFMAEFGLSAFAAKFAARADTYGTTACLTRAINELVLALFALNRRYPLTDKTALAEVAEFERAPREFGPRVRKTLAQPGASPEELAAAVESVGQLLRETVELTEGLYQRRFTLPK
ncbi:MAG: nucleotidyltransferase domain-containing protein [Gemmataceae bacterium]